VWPVCGTPVSFFGALVYVGVDRQDEKAEFRINGWKWIFYGLGCLGFIDFVFWLFAFSRYRSRSKKCKGELLRFAVPQFVVYMRRVDVGSACHVDRGGNVCSCWRR